ncbi:ABC transporter substrate-binding protein [uncultured Ligilactobacillus sp.]|uniref:ABC transporter substrate-binding protein n=1 Tax=uncultured Ligilactobacillus sp. TaxID=2837633 RepID=UPI00272D1F3F|nr:ABC transporter substrate-binding protein [uncultured Ligilactobacillus sp.]
MKKNWGVRSFLALATAVMVQGTVSTNVYATKLPLEYNNHKKQVKGGTLHVGLASGGVFKGVFAPPLRVDIPTAEVAQFGERSLFKVNNDYTYAKGGLADVTFDQDQKTATVKIKKSARWSDGHPVEAKDMEYTYKVVADPATNSGDYDDKMRDIVGMEEYHDGKANDISGVEIKDEKTCVVHFKEMKPDMKFPSSGYVLGVVMPYHYLKDVPFDQLASSDKIQKTPLFYGPFKIKNMVKGESIEWVPNKYYGGKKPNLSKITIEVVDPGHAAAAMKSNKYDVLLEQSPAVYNKVKNLPQYVVLGEKEKYYSYVGFKVGHFKNGVNVMDRKTPVQDRALRQAMGYALNMDQISKKFGYGLKYRANTIVPDAFGKYSDHKLKGYPLDLKKANKLLDKAGYRMQKNGYRTLPNGKKFTLKLLASMSSDSAGSRNVIEMYLQQWKKIGVKVELKDNRLQEFNSYIEQLTNDGKGYDIYLSNWSVTSAPTSSIAETYLPNNPYNLSHFVTKENTELIKSLSSKEAFNTDYQIKQFYKWQAYMNREAYIIPRQFEYDTYTFSKKLTNVSLNNKNGYHLWENIAFTK